MTRFINQLIELFKWPCALIMVLNLPHLIQQDWNLVVSSMKSSNQYFWAGVLAYVISWRVVFANRLFGTWFPTLVHESIHALFAVLTGHKVVDFKVRWNSGGHIHYRGGKGNWVILLSPYFFPFTTILALIMESIFGSGSFERPVILGACFGFELLYVWRQIHRDQTDYQQAGWVFVITFLPGMILLTYGLMLSLLLTVSSPEQIFIDLWNNTQQVILSVLSPVLPYFERFI